MEFVWKSEVDNTQPVPLCSHIHSGTGLRSLSDYTVKGHLQQLSKSEGEMDINTALPLLNNYLLYLPLSISPRFWYHVVAFPQQISPFTVADCYNDMAGNCCDKIETLDI